MSLQDLWTGVKDFFGALDTPTKNLSSLGIIPAPTEKKPKSLADAKLLAQSKVKPSSEPSIQDINRAIDEYYSKVPQSVSDQVPAIQPVTYIPPAPSAETVSRDVVVSDSPYSIYGEWEPYFQLIKEQSEANTARQIEFARQQNRWQEHQNKVAMDFNAAEAAKNRGWQQYMSNTAHQREVQDLQAAGLNPVLSATGGNGAAVTSGATASGVTSSGTKPEVDSGTMAGMLNLLNNVMGYAMQTATASMSSAATVAAAGATAGATRYAADVGYSIKQDFPQTGAALAASLGNDLAKGLGYSSWSDALVSFIKKADEKLFQPEEKQSFWRRLFKS